MKVSEMIRQAAPTYRIVIKDPMKGWLNLDKKTIYTATREMGHTGAYWHITSLKKDVPDWNVHVIQTDQELKKLQGRGYKESQTIRSAGTLTNENVWDLAKKLRGKLDKSYRTKSPAAQDTRWVFQSEDGYRHFVDALKSHYMTFKADPEEQTVVVWF